MSKKDYIKCCKDCYNIINEEMMNIGANVCESCFDKEYVKYVNAQMNRSQIDCPFNEPLHYHHDGCPACEQMYLPLPKEVTIKNSEVHGLGLFAVTDIEANTELGISHVKDDRFQHGYIRTPLGGFFNHSEEPNCEAYIDEANNFIRLRTLTQIKSGLELTVKYWLYEMK
tara:strand:- start:95 stop:604 length:510 start_codon:yes stop_codon:yes gene_type:complete